MNAPTVRIGLVLGALGAAATLALAPPASATYTPPSCSVTVGTTPFTNLQDAVNSTSAGGKVTIKGVCNEATIPRSMTLRADKTGGVLEPSGGGVTLLTVGLTDPGTSVRLEGLILRNASRGISADGDGSGDGTLTLSATKIISNNAGGGYGGGIYCDDNANVIVDGGSEIAYNRAEYGGGIFSENACAVTVRGTGTTIHDNYAGTHGGGVYTRADATFIGPSRARLAPVMIYKNTAGNLGGGLHSNNGGNITLTGYVYFTGNTATNGGGAIGTEASPSALIFNIAGFAGSTCTGTYGANTPNSVDATDSSAC